MKEGLPKLVDEYPDVHWDKYYGHTFYCPNCGRRNVRWILKGHYIKNVAFDCEKCGCEISDTKA